MYYNREELRELLQNTTRHTNLERDEVSALQGALEVCMGASVISLFLSAVVFLCLRWAALSVHSLKLCRIPVSAQAHNGGRNHDPFASRIYAGGGLSP